MPASVADLSCSRMSFLVYAALCSRLPFDRLQERICSVQRLRFEFGSQDREVIVECRTPSEGRCDMCSMVGAAGLEPATSCV